MVQDIVTPLSRQLETYRHQAVTAPSLLDDGTLAPSHVAEVLAKEGFQGRNRLFPPHGSCREAVSRMRPWMIAQGHTPCSPHTGSYCQARQRLPEGVISSLARQ